MARYFFHYWEDHARAGDLDGADLSNAYAAFMRAFETAQDLSAGMSTEEARGRRIEVVDAGGRVMFDLCFLETLRR
jgi:hypothetical protein